MKTHGDATVAALTAPSVLAIACTPELVARCREALEGIGVGLRECSFVEAPTVAAERRPLAIVMLEDLYAFDPEELDALARDVQASLVRVDEDASVAMLELLLTAAIDAAAARRSELLPAWGTSENSRRTVPNPRAQAYRVGERLPSQSDVMAAAWQGRIPTPVPPSGW
jgi:hypothetical protein